MGDRYLKFEIAVLQRLYPTATKREILAEIPGRNWVALSAHARRIGLHRTQKTKRLHMLAGRLEAKARRKKNDEGSS